MAATRTRRAAAKPAETALSQADRKADADAQAATEARDARREQASAVYANAVQALQVLHALADEAREQGDDALANRIALRFADLSRTTRGRAVAICPRDPRKGAPTEF